MSSLAVGFPDWQRITQWFGSPVEQATAYAIGAGQKVIGPLNVRNFASVVVCVAPHGGNVTVTVDQQVPGGPAALKTSSTFVVNNGNAVFEAFVLLAGVATVTLQGSAGGETLDYAIVPSNTNVNAEVAALTQLGFQHNDVVVATETAIDLEDGTYLTWTMVDDPANLRMKVTPVITGLAAADGWVALTGAFTYSSADGPTGVINTPSDLTAVIPLGARFSYVQSGATKYGIVTAIAAGTITVYGGTDYTTANAAITVPRYSLVKGPAGFNASPTKWTETLRDTTLRSQATPAPNTWYNISPLSLALPIGVWETDYAAVVAVQSVGVTGMTQILCKLTLSTANNSESDSDMSAYGSAFFDSNSGSPLIEYHMARRKLIAVTVKTTYYLNMLGNGSAGISSLYIPGTGNTAGATLIRATCAYL